MLDESAIRRLEDWGGPPLAQKMIRLFLDTSHRRVRQVRDGLDANAIDVAERGAHSLKSSAANVGATRLTEVAGQMERHLSEGEPEKARTLLGALESAHREALAALRAVEAALP